MGGREGSSRQDCADKGREGKVERKEERAVD